MDNTGFRPLFAKDSLEGWKIWPRGLYYMEKDSEEYRSAWKHPGQWSMADGVLEGRQDPPGCGYGSYLVSEEEFTDFELIYEAKPDWPADTGIYLRASEDGCVGYQVLLDHRKSGSIGGYYANALGYVHAINWNVDAKYDSEGNPVGICIETPETTLEPITDEKPASMTYKISGEEFLRIWKWNDWNEFRVVCQGALPTLTTYINGVKVAAADLAALDNPKFLKDKALQMCSKGRIAIEVHDNDPGMGDARWGKNAACRWRNMRIREL